MITLLAGAGLAYLCYKTCKKRTEIQHRCPKCGTMVNASPWSTGLQYKGGGYLHNFHCKHCGNKFVE